MASKNLQKSDNSAFDSYTVLKNLATKLESTPVRPLDLSNLSAYGQVGENGATVAFEDDSLSSEDMMVLRPQNI